MKIIWTQIVQHLSKTQGVEEAVKLYEEKHDYILEEKDREIGLALRHSSATENCS